MITFCKKIKGSCFVLLLGILLAGCGESPQPALNIQEQEEADWGEDKVKRGLAKREKIYYYVICEKSSNSAALPITDMGGAGEIPLNGGDIPQTWLRYAGGKFESCAFKFSLVQ